MKTYQYRIYPDKSQQERLCSWFGQARFVYNKGLKIWNTMYKNGEKVNYYKLNSQLKERKEEHEWLKECGSQCLQQSLRNLDRGFQNFFKKRGKYPKFKGKNKINSLVFPQRTRITDNHIVLPKLGLIKCKFHRSVEGNLKSMSVKKTPTGKYFVSITTDYEQKKSKGKGTVAIDVGIKEFGVCSDGVIIKNPKHLSRHLKKLKKAQRKLSRKKKGSKNRDKQKLRVARLHEKVSNSRKDFLHKTSTAIAKQYETLILEDLRVSKMIKNKQLSRSIGDVGRRSFRTLCEYKMNVIAVESYNTSKTCSSCGNIKDKLGLNVRMYTCDACGLELDRDYNASLNILARGVA